MTVPKAGTGRERVFRTEGFVISHPGAGTCKNTREKRKRVGTERMRKKTGNREAGGFVNSAVTGRSDALYSEIQLHSWERPPGEQNDGQTQLTT